MTFARRIKTFLLFVVAAPPIAAIPLAVLLTISRPTDPQGLGLGILALLFSYPIGVVPAGVAGATFILLNHWLNREKSLPSSQRIFLLGACCGIVGILFLFALFIVISTDTPQSSIGSLALFFLPLGFLSGGICGVLSLRLLDEEFTSFAAFRNSQIGRWLQGILFVMFFILALALVALNDKI